MKKSPQRQARRLHEQSLPAQAKRYNGFLIPE